MNSTNVQPTDEAAIVGNNVLAAGFICQGCKHELPMDFNLRTEGFCYLCDPNITLAECLSDEPIERVPKACS